MPIEQSMRFRRLLPPWGLELRSASCMFDLVSTVSNDFLRWSLWIAVIRASRILYWVVIPYSSTLLIVYWLYSYSFDWVPMGYPIDLKNLLSSFDLTLLCTLLLFLHLNFFWKFLIVSWLTSQWWYRWIDELWKWLSVCMIYPLRGLHHNMCEGSCSIP